MEKHDPPGEAMAGGNRDTAGAINFVAGALGVLGALAVLDAGAFVASLAGAPDLHGTVGGHLLPGTALGSGVVRASVLLAVGALDGAVVVGLRRMASLAYWAGLALFALHALLAALANVVVALLAVLVGIILLRHRRSFRLAG